MPGVFSFTKELIALAKSQGPSEGTAPVTKAVWGRGATTRPLPHTWTPGSKSPYQ